MPFTPPQIARTAAKGARGVARFVFVGDVEHGHAIDRALEAIATMSTPHGLDDELVVAARDKSALAIDRKNELLARISKTPSLARRVRWVGRVPSLAALLVDAVATILPADDGVAKLDHPRALLESIAVGTPIVVGTVASHRELLTAPSIGVAVDDASSLAAAMESMLSAPPIDRDAAIALLSPRRSDLVAAQYVDAYLAARALTHRA
jgi:glycosyltransferase involved in cell wall biosynthesis